jgi:hypothetical protein
MVKQQGSFREIQGKYAAKQTGYRRLVVVVVSPRGFLQRITTEQNHRTSMTKKSSAFPPVPQSREGPIKKVRLELAAGGV